MADSLDVLVDLLGDLGPAPYVALVMVVAVCAQALAWRARVPSILMLLLAGFGLGLVLDPEAVLGRDVLFGGVTLAVGIILFEGSLSLRFRELKELRHPVLRLCSLTVVIAWALITLAAMLVGFGPEVSVLVGAILVVTGPTVISPILRSLRPTRRVSALLRWEGIVVDPIGAILAVLVFQAIVSGRGEGTIGGLLTTLGLTIAVAVVLALMMGVLLEVLTVRHAVPDHLQGVAYLAAAVGVLTASNALQSESGLLTVTLLGLYLGNRERLHLNHVAEFTEHLQVLLVGALFVVLAGRIAPGTLVDVAPQALAFVLLLVVVVRPLSVVLGLLGTDIPANERSLLARMAPRGIVAAAVTSIFALEFRHAADEAREHGNPRADQLADIADQAQAMVPLVFLVIVCTVALYGLGIGRVAERLGLAASSPQGVLFAGGQDWIVQVAARLEADGFPCVLVAREYADLAAARRAGLTSVTADILSDYAVRDMDLAGIRVLVACTGKDEVNAMAAREFSPVLGRAQVFQLLRADHVAGAATRRRAPAAHLSARTPFVPAVAHDRLQELIGHGWRVTRTQLTESFTLEQFHATHGAEAILLFVSRGDRLEVATEDSDLPDADATVYALVAGSGQD